MSKQRIATLTMLVLVSNYVSFQAGLSSGWYRRPPSSPAAGATRQEATYGVNRVLRFTPTRIDLGVVTGKAPVTKLVAYTNLGDETVMIGDVKASCGCTFVNVSQRTVEPGGKGELEIIFNPALSGPEVAVSVSVAYNGSTFVDRLLLTGEVSSR